MFTSKMGVMPFYSTMIHNHEQINLCERVLGWYQKSYSKQIKTHSEGSSAKLNFNQFIVKSHPIGSLNNVPENV